MRVVRMTGTVASVALVLRPTIANTVVPRQRSGFVPALESFACVMALESALGFVGVGIHGI